MKNQLFKNKGSLIIAAVLIGTSLFGADGVGSSDITGGLGEAGDILTKGGNIFLQLLAWILLIGMPAGSYYIAYSHFKQNDEQDRSGSANKTLLHGKAAGVAMVTLFVASMLVKFIFVNTLGFGSIRDVAKNVMGIAIPAPQSNTQSNGSSGASMFPTN